MAIAYARLAKGQGAARRAEKAIEKAWSKNPHPDLARAYLEIDGLDDSLQRLRKIEKLAVLRPNHPESVLAVGEAALKAEIWGEAKSNLEKAIAARPSARAFRAMAELEAAEPGNEAAAQWLARAAEASADPHWVCGNCGAIAESWAPVCAHCDAFDRFAWRLPGPIGLVDDAMLPSHLSQKKAVGFQG
ncbi:MAG: hypothetical protein COA65_10060 [Rhodospirillaceae bacterium]|nr:MAG: hypothetical protein COA65_10060 [Rhodospirillaceae bacterium]